MRTVVRAWGGYRFMCPIQWYLNRHLAIVLPEKSRVELLRVTERKGKVSLTITFDIELTLEGRNVVRYYYFSGVGLEQKKREAKGLTEVAATVYGDTCYYLYQLDDSAVTLLKEDTQA